MWGREIGVRPEMSVNEMHKVSADECEETENEGSEEASG